MLFGAIAHRLDASQELRALCFEIVKALAEALLRRCAYGGDLAGHYGASSVRQFPLTLSSRIPPPPAESVKDSPGQTRFAGRLRTGAAHSTFVVTAQRTGSVQLMLPRNSASPFTRQQFV